MENQKPLLFYPNIADGKVASVLACTNLDKSTQIPARDKAQEWWECGWTGSVYYICICVGMHLSRATKLEYLTKEAVLEPSGDV